MFGLNATWFALQGERTFEEARAYCKSQGGDLMSIESQEEQDNVLPIIIPEYNLYKNFWIGLKRKEDAHGEEYPAEYEWVDGTVTDYQHFAGKVKCTTFNCHSFNCLLSQFDTNMNIE